MAEQAPKETVTVDATEGEETPDASDKSPSAPKTKRCIILISLVTVSALLLAVAIAVPIVVIASKDKSDVIRTHCALYSVIDYDNKHTDGSYRASNYVRNGKEYIYTAKNLTGDELQNVFNTISSGDTVILDGSEGPFHLTTAKLTTGGITMKGRHNAVLDFSGTYGEYTKEDVDAAIAIALERFGNGYTHYLVDFNISFYSAMDHGKGIIITSEYNLFQDLELFNASDNCINIAQGGNYNLFRNVTVHHCGDAGVQLNGNRLKENVDCSQDFETGGPHDNKFFGCISRDNYDPWNLGENADGFAVRGRGTTLKSVCQNTTRMMDGIAGIFEGVRRGWIVKRTIMDCHQKRRRTGDSAVMGMDLRWGVDQ